MYKRLRELNIPSVIIRDSDETLPKNERIERVLNAYNNSPNTILISNHINAGGGEGAEIVYALRNNDTLASMVLDNIGKAGQLKRSIYQRVLPEDPTKDYYYIIRETGATEPLLIEYGFIDNVNDAQKLNQNIEKYVEGVVKAIADYAGYEYTTSVTDDFYIVEKGDTLYSIANQFGTTVAELKRINNLTSDTLSIGTKLLIQEQKIEPENFYIVEKGDTLYSIANKLNLSVEQLKELNNLTSNIISIGQTLQLPNTNIPEIPNLTEIYIVKKGDSLWSIAQNYNTTVNDLIELNNLTTINLQIGDQLFVPKIPETNEITYTVKPGDTLWSIARQYNLTVQELKDKNNLTSNLLSLGQQLIIS